MNKKQWNSYILRYESRKTQALKLYLHFGYYYAPAKEGDPIVLPVCTQDFGGAESFVYLTEYHHVSEKRIESALLFIVLRTKYNKELTPTMGRYTFDFQKMSPSLLRRIINFMLKSEHKRINLSWLAPLQELLLDKEDKFFNKKKTKSEAFIVEQEEVPDPFEHENESLNIFLNDNHVRSHKGLRIEEDALPPERLSIRPVDISVIGTETDSIKKVRGVPYPANEAVEKPKLNNKNDEWKLQKEVEGKRTLDLIRLQLESPSLKDYKRVLLKQKLQKLEKQLAYLW